MTETIDIKRKRGDTRRHIFIIKDPDTEQALDITGWSNFKLTVDPQKSPTSNTNNIGQIIGLNLDDGAALKGHVGFSPPGTWPIGSYFYDAQAIDVNGEKVTFVEGKYKIEQDITKD